MAEPLQGAASPAGGAVSPLELKRFSLLAHLGDDERQALADELESFEVGPGTVLFEQGARRRMQAGDELEVAIEGIGSVRSTIVPMNGLPWPTDGNEEN